MWNNPHRLPSPSLRRGPSNGTRRGVGSETCSNTPPNWMSDGSQTWNNPHRLPSPSLRRGPNNSTRRGQVVRRVTTPRPLFAGCPARVIGHAQCLRRGYGRSWHVASEQIAPARRAQRSTALVGARALVGRHARCLAPRSSLEAPSSHVVSRGRRAWQGTSVDTAAPSRGRWFLPPPLPVEAAMR